MKMYKRMAKSISYSPTKRNRKDVKYIVIHYTGNSNDTAKTMLIITLQETQDLPEHISS